VSLLRESGYTTVSHYPGGLTEWLEFEQPIEAGLTLRATAGAVTVDLGRDPRPHRARSDRAAPPVTHDHAASPAAQRFRAASLSSRFVDALADRSVGALFWLWIAIVLGCPAKLRLKPPRTARGCAHLRCSTAYLAFRAPRSGAI